MRYWVPPDATVNRWSLPPSAEEYTDSPGFGAASDANAKIGTLNNMLTSARPDIIILSDSDLEFGRDYRAHVDPALVQPGLGEVT